MKKQINIKTVRLYLWMGLIYLLLSLLATWHSYPAGFLALFGNNVWAVVYVTVVNYVLFEYSVAFLFKKRTTIIYNILLAVPLGFVYILLYSFGAYAWRRLGIQLQLYTPLKVFASTEAALENQVGYSVGSVFLFAIIRYIYAYIKLKHLSQQLLIEKQAAELGYLKSQTNPHFLFNTLNNIYSLARDKSDMAPEAILRLSKILRFMLYETSGAFIDLEQEIKIISDYIALEQLRYDESLSVRFNHDIENMRQAIPPLLLIPLVENAFKHGVSETRGRPFVDIHLSVNKRQLKFQVKNSADASAEASVKENIGLSNLRRQLELLYTDYGLTVQQGEHEFTATLKINLASHV